MNDGRGEIMKQNPETISFSDKQHFHRWLDSNHVSHPGIWVRFDKTRKVSTMTPEEALDEALCFGWIDGQIQSIDEQFYLKYFAKRSNKSIWSTKNKNSVERLIKEGKMMPLGLTAVELAKKDGRWEKADHDPIDFSVDDFTELLRPNEKALKNYMTMSPSVRKTYAISYYALKKEDSRQRRLQVIMERLEKNLKPM